MAAAALLALALALALAPSTLGFMLPSFYTQCESTLAANQASFSSLSQNGVQNAYFSLYDLADRTKCVGRVPHAVDSSLTMLGWTECDSSTGEGPDKLVFSLANPYPALPSVSYRYYRFQVHRVRAVSNTDNRQFHLSEFQLYFGNTQRSIPTATPTPTLVDGSLTSGFTSSSSPWPELVFDMGASGTTVNSYRFAPLRSSSSPTLNARDPVTWALFGRDSPSNTWILLDERSLPEAVPLGSVPTASYTPKFSLFSWKNPFPAALPDQLYANGNVGEVLRSVQVRTKYFRYWKWTPKLWRMAGNDKGQQISEIQFLFRGTLQKASTAKTPDGAASPAGGVEAAAKAVDDDIFTKWYTSTEGASLLIDLGSAKPVDSYLFVTAEDIPERDPFEWLLWGSNNDQAYALSWADNSLWTLVDASFGQVDNIPIRRRVFTKAFPLTYNLGSVPLLAGGTDPGVPWFQLNVKGTSEFVVAAFYRNLALANQCSSCTACTLMPAGDTSSQSGLTTFNLVTSTKMLSGSRRTPLSSVASVYEAYGSTILKTTAGVFYLYGKNFLYAHGPIHDAVQPTRLVMLGSTFTQVTKGQDHYIALTSSGKVYTWGTQGSFGSGQLGQNSLASSSLYEPTEISGSFTGVSQVIAGHWFSAFLRSGTVYTFGSNTNGNLGDGTTTPKGLAASISFPGGGITITKLVPSGWAVYALDSTGQWWAWGDGDYLPFSSSANVLTPTNTNLDCSTLSTAGGTGYCLKPDGSLWAWGSPSALQSSSGNSLGDGTTGTSLTPKQIMAPGTVKSIAQPNTFAIHFCLTKHDDSLWCWGRNAEFGLGLSHNNNINLPTQVPGMYVTSGSMFLGGSWTSQETTCVLPTTAPTQLTCWGGSTKNQLGIPTTATNLPRASIPSVVAFGGMIGSIFTQQQSTIARLVTGEVYLYGKSYTTPTSAPVGTAQTVPLRFTDLGDTFAKVEKGDYHFVGLSSSGKVYAWGEQNHHTKGQLGQASDADGSWYYPREISTTPSGVLDVCAGHWFSCYLGGGNNVLCWGTNRHGVLGRLALNEYYQTPAQVSSVGGLGSGQVARLWCAGWAVYVKTFAGTFYTWGQWDWLPINAQTDVFGPVSTSALSGCIDLSFPGAVGYCLKSDGTLWAWGSPSAQSGHSFGDGTFGGSRRVPFQVSMPLPVKSLAMASNEALHMCVILSDDSPRCWGAGGSYALGLTHVASMSLPQKLPGMPAVSRMFVGGAWNSGGTTCATLQASKDTVCWGENAMGQLGRGDTVSPVPRVVARFLPVGCYGDQGARRLPTLLWDNSPQMTPQVCADLAMSAKLSLFAVQNGNQCFGGTDYSLATNMGTVTTCTVSCSGDSSQTCGGGYSNQMYIVEDLGDKTQVRIMRGVPFEYLGCYVDGTPRRLPAELLTNYPHMTVEHCGSLARAFGYKYFGVENSQECYAGDDLSFAQALGTSTVCTSTCTGDSTAVCGGVWALSLYTFADMIAEHPPVPRALALETSSSSTSYALDHVYLSGLVRPVTGLLSGATVSQYRFLWFTGEDPQTSLSLSYRPHPITTKNCMFWSVSSTAVTTRFMEMGWSPSTTSSNMYVFKTATVDTESVAKSSVASAGPHRFIGNYACGCGYNETTTYKGECFYRNECPESQGGDDTATCGLNSKCSDSMYGYQCQCSTGYAYDQATGRAIRNADDVNAISNEETTECSPAPYSVLVSNEAMYLTIGTKALNYSYYLYYVDSTTGLALTSGELLLGSTDLAPGNTSYAFTGLTPNQQYFLQVNFSNSNASVFNTYFRIPCTCDGTTRLSFDAATPRIDDGKPIFGSIEQMLAKIYFSWSDFSKCENSFSPIRLEPTTGAQLDVDTSDPVAFSGVVQGYALTPYSLTTSYVKETSADSSCSTKYGGVPNGLVFDSSKVTSFDDVSRFEVGKPVFYCVTASGPDTYRSGYSCYPSVVRVLWEAVINVQVNVGYPNVLSVARNVLVSWRVLHLTEGGTDETLYLSAGMVVDSGDGYTDNNGRMKIHSRVDQGVYETVTTTSKLLFVMEFSKVDVVPELPEPIRHSFYCNTPYRDCTAQDPATVFVSHLSFSELTVEARDLTTVPVSGVVYIDGTENPDNGIPLGCPLSGVKVCIYTSPIRDDSVLFGCVYTGLDGAYEIPVTMGVTAEVVLEYNSHRFQRVDSTGAWVSSNVLKVKALPINGVYFKDVQKETVYVDLAGGLCNVTIATNLTLTLSRMTQDVCLGFANDFTFTLFSDFTFKATVPATYLEFGFSDAAMVTVDTNVGSALGVLNYLGQRYLGDNLVSLNMTSLDAADNGSTPSEETLRQRRTLRFEYNPIPSLEVSFWQNETTGVGVLTNVTLVRKDRDTGCADPETMRVLEYMGDPNDPVLIRVEPVQRFFDPVSECRYIDGTVAVQNLLGQVVSNAARTILSPLEASLLEVCREWCDIDLLTGEITGDVTPTNTSSISPTSPGGTNSTNSTTSANATAPSSSTPVIRNVSAELHVLPTPDIAAPHTKYVNVQFRGANPGEVGATIQMVILVLGHALDANAAFTKISFTSVPPIMVVRDPPGDLSYAWYKNIESTVHWETKDNDWFEGTNGVYDFRIGITQSNDVCVGLGAAACKRILDMDKSVDGSIQIGTSKLLSSRRRRNKFSRTFLWSVETPHRTDISSPNGQTMLTPGPQSDVFVVAIESFFYTLTHVIHEPFPGACTAEDTLRYTLVVPQGGAGDFGLGFYTRYDIQTRTLPILEKLRDDPANENITELATQVQNWYDILGASGEVATADVPTMAPTTTRLYWALADVGLNIVAILPLGALLKKFEPVKGIRNKIVWQALYALTLGTKEALAWAAFGGATAFRFIETNPLLPPDLEINSDSSQVSKFQLLPTDLGLWIKSQKSAEVQALDNYNMIEFSGGGNMISFETKDMLFGEFSSAWRNNAKYLIAFKSKSAFSPFGVKLELDTYNDVVLEHNVEVVMAAAHQQETTAGFRLGDSTPGDYFQLTVDRDNAYGTYIFTPKAGIASCPQEPGFGKRDFPDLLVKLSPNSAVPPDEPAVFLFEISNTALEVRTYVITAHLVDLQDDARITVDGMSLDEPRVFADLAPLAKTDALIKVFRGSRRFSYALKVTLASQCDPSVKSEYVLSVDFIPPCPAVALAGKLATEGTITLNVNSNGYVVPLAARNLDESGARWGDNPRVVSARFEYRFVGFADWADVWVRTPDNDVAELVDDPVFRIGAYAWDLTNLPEQDVRIEVRAVVLCAAVAGLNAADHPSLFRRESLVGTVRVDRVPPTVVDSRELEVHPGARIDVEFTEPLRCGAGGALPFSMNLVVRGMETTTYTAETGNLAVECSGSRVSVVPTSNTILLFDRDAVLTLYNVKDLAGNKAVSNVILLHSGDLDSSFEGVVERRFHFARADVQATSYFAAGLVFPITTFPGGPSTNDTFVDEVLAGSLALALGGISPDRIRTSRYEFESGFCIADLTIAPPLEARARPPPPPSLTRRLLRQHHHGRDLGVLVGNLDDPDNTVDVGQALLVLTFPGGNTGFVLVETGKVGVGGVTDRGGETQFAALSTEIERLEVRLSESEERLNEKLERVTQMLRVLVPDTKSPTVKPTVSPTAMPTTKKPTVKPTSKAPTKRPTTGSPTTKAPSKKPTTKQPTVKPTTKQPTVKPTTDRPSAHPSVAPGTQKRSAMDALRAALAEGGAADASALAPLLRRALAEAEGRSGVVPELVREASSLSALLNEDGSAVLYRPENTLMSWVMGRDKAVAFMQACWSVQFILGLLTFLGVMGVLGVLALMGIIPDEAGAVAVVLVFIPNILVEMAVDLKIAWLITRTPEFLARSLLGVIVAITLGVIGQNRPIIIIPLCVMVANVVWLLGLTDSLPSEVRYLSAPPVMLVAAAMALLLLILVNTGLIPDQMNPTAVTFSAGTLGFSRYTIDTSAYAVFNQSVVSLLLFLVLDALQRFRHYGTRLTCLNVPLRGLDGEGSPKLHSQYCVKLFKGLNPQLHQREASLLVLPVGA